MVADITLRATLLCGFSNELHQVQGDFSALMGAAETCGCLSLLQDEQKRRDVVHMIHVGRNETGSGFKRCKDDLDRHVGTDFK